MSLLRLFLESRTNYFNREAPRDAGGEKLAPILDRLLGLNRDGADELRKAQVEAAELRGILKGMRMARGNDSKPKPTKAKKPAAASEGPQLD